MTRLVSRLFRKVAKIGMVALAAAYLTAPVAFAQQPQPKPPAFSMKETNRIAVNGDAQFRGEMTLAKDLYAALKKETPDPVHLLQKFGIKSEETVTEAVKASWNDAGSSVRYEFASRGHARIGKDGLWGTPVPDGVAVSIRKFENGVAELEFGADAPGVGRVAGRATVTFPEGATDLKLNRDKTRLTYNLPEPAAAGRTARAAFDVDAKKHVLGCLTKVLSNRKFATLWTARGVFKNTGDTVLKDYRVRFRMADYTSAWSPWAGTPVVVPGQTVVDTYFPAMDQEKVAKLTGQTKAAVEVQYQYTRADGKLVEDSETKEVTLLARNQVHYSSMTSEESRDFGDANDLTAFVLAALVSHEDPVIQQAAGRICKAGGGFNAAGSDAEAIKFMTAAYDFLSANIAYQTPPGHVSDRKLVQHVKYGRDVLKNKAGTCIDLAILYGSLCDAVGLETVLFGTSDHCFPGVYLPKSRKLLTVEATLIGVKDFTDAANHSTEKNMKPILDGSNPAVPARIADLHNAGVHPLDLPVLADDVLDKWGITFDGKAVEPMPKPQPKVNANVPVGLWRTTFRTGNVTWVQTTGIDGDGRIGSTATSDTGFSIGRKGTFVMKGKAITITLTDGSGHAGTVELTGKDTFTFTGDNGEVLYYTRVK